MCRKRKASEKHKIHQTPVAAQGEPLSFDAVSTTWYRQTCESSYWSIWPTRGREVMATSGQAVSTHSNYTTDRLWRCQVSSLIVMPANQNFHTWKLTDQILILLYLLRTCWRSVATLVPAWWRLPSLSRMLSFDDGDKMKRKRHSQTK